MDLELGRVGPDQGGLSFLTGLARCNAMFFSRAGKPQRTKAGREERPGDRAPATYTGRRTTASKMFNEPRECRLLTI